MVDISAGLNLDKHSFHHNSIHKRYPGLVLQSTVLTDLENSNPYGIGGLGGSSSAASITHVITYEIPWRVDGKPVTITDIALGNNIVFNTILLCLFFKVILKNYTIVS